MNTANKVIKYVGYGLAISLIVSIFSGIAFMLSGNWFGLMNHAETPAEIITLKDDTSKKVLDITANAARIAVKRGDTLSAKCDEHDVEIKVDGDQLTIKDNKQKFFNDGDYIEVTIPEDMVFDGVSISVGAGDIKIDSLMAKELYLNTGASKVSIGKVVVDERAKIDTGVGEFKISDGVLTNLDLNLGVGSSHIAAKLLGDAEINSGIGAVNLILIGVEKDYSVSVEKGIGDIKIDDRSVSDDTIVGNGENKVRISGGIGAIKVNYKQEQKPMVLEEPEAAPAAVPVAE